MHLYTLSLLNSSCPQLLFLSLIKSFNPSPILFLSSSHLYCFLIQLTPHYTSLQFNILACLSSYFMCPAASQPWINLVNRSSQFLPLRTDDSGEYYTATQILRPPNPILPFQCLTKLLTPFSLML